MVQAFPHYSLLVERLWFSSVAAGGWGNGITRLCGLPRTVSGVHPNTFDANLQTIECSFIYIPRAPRGDRLTTDVQKGREQSV